MTVDSRSIHSPHPRTEQKQGKMITILYEEDYNKIVDSRDWLFPGVEVLGYLSQSLTTNNVFPILGDNLINLNFSCQKFLFFFCLSFYC